MARLLAEMEASDSTPWLNDEQYRHWRAFIDGTAWLTEALAQDLEKHAQITLSDYAVLVRLSEIPGRCTRMSQLAADLSHSRSRMTHTVRRLEERGYVRRYSCGNDGRGVNCEMTEAGYSALVTAAPGHARAVQELFISKMSPAELATVGKVLERILAERDS